MERSGTYSRRRLKTWKQWAKWACRIQRAQRRNAAIAADPWRRKIHSLAVALRQAEKLRSVPPIRRPVREPATWEEWAKREAKKLAAQRAWLSPWERWAKRKAVGLAIRRRRLRGGRENE